MGPGKLGKEFWQPSFIYLTLLFFFFFLFNERAHVCSLRLCSYKKSFWLGVAVTLKRQRWEDQEFKANLGYAVNSRPVWPWKEGMEQAELGRLPTILVCVVTPQGRPFRSRRAKMMSVRAWWPESSPQKPYKVVLWPPHMYHGTWMPHVHTNNNDGDG